MAILQAMDGKYYDIPDTEATAFEVPRDKVKALLEKSGMPAPQSPRPGAGGGPGGGAPGPAGGAPGPVVVQIFAGPQGAPAQGPSAPAPSAGQDGEVDPYWIWRNVSYGGRWWNTWGNW